MRTTLSLFSALGVFLLVGCGSSSDDSPGSNNNTAGSSSAGSAGSSNGGGGSNNSAASGGSTSGGSSSGGSGGASAASGSSGSSGSNTGGSGGSAGSPAGQTFSVTFDPLTVQPGQENTQCVLKKLGNPSRIYAHQIHNVLPEGSHHLIVYRTNDTEEKLEPYDCQPFVDTLDPTKGSPLMVTQKHDETLTLPDGVAFDLDANVMIRLEMHYINVTDQPLDVSATSTFVTMDSADFQYAADFLFLGNPDINIGPHSQFTLGPTFLPLPEDLAGSKFFGITGHTHQFGTNVTVNLAETKNGPDTPLYDVPNWQWSEPATVMLDPVVELPTGAGFRFTCDYNNTSNNTVGFGESANDEMCFFWAYYYPSKGSRVCAHSNQVGGPEGYDICCPGNPFCSQLF